MVKAVSQFDPDKRWNPPAKYVEALLIGGAGDGARISVAENLDMIRYSVLTPVEPVNYETYSDATFTVQIATYHRVPFELSDGMRRGDFCLYLHESIKMDMFDVVQRLFMGYGRAKSEDKI